MYALNLSALAPAALEQKHPAIVDIFTDEGSVLHVGAGFVSGFLDGRSRLAAFSGFTAYELSKAATGESWQRTGGKFLEFGIGLAAAALLRGAA